MNNPFSERPNRLPLPPILFIGSVLAAYAMASAAPLPVPKETWLRAIGAILIGGGLTLIVTASITLARGGTTILPHMASSRIVTSGPYVYSRNPIYLGEAMLLAGLGAIEGSVWHLVMAITFVNLVSLLAVVREEAHLKANFPEEWAAYSAKVRRWL